jgi:hypothetical protein
MAIEALLVDEAKRAALGAAARDTAKARFDFDASVETYRALFERMGV